MTAANLTWVIGGDATASPSSWARFLEVPEGEIAPKPRRRHFRAGQVGEVKQAVLKAVQAADGLTSAAVRSCLCTTGYSVGRINVALSQLAVAGKVKREREGGRYVYRQRDLEVA